VNEYFFEENSESMQNPRPAITLPNSEKTAYDPGGNVRTASYQQHASPVATLVAKQQAQPGV
jgi:hypothetical protein